LFICLHKQIFGSEAWWYMSAILATWEVEAGESAEGLRVQGQPKQSYTKYRAGRVAQEERTCPAAIRP
jgi:hypothetical protein